MRVPTVKIKADDVEGGHVVINESDFDKDNHVLYEAPPPPPVESKSDEVPPPPPAA